MNSRQSLGQHGERLVAAYLCKKGYEILAQNFRVRKSEIDIIVRSGNVVRFVEVKTRNNPRVDSAELISPSKQRSIQFAAVCFIAQNFSKEVIGVQFDVALVDCTYDEPRITYLENAFEGSDDV